jgi:hypothetical protein
VTALDLPSIQEEFLNQCGPCDLGVPAQCNCPKRDFRPTMLDLFREVERQRKLLDILRETLAQIDALNTFGELSEDRVTALLERMQERCDLLAEVDG